MAYIVRDTLWNVSKRLPVAGPLTDQEWQATVVQAIAPATYVFRLSNFGLCIYPVAPVFIQFSIEVVVREVVLGATVADFKTVMSYKDTFAGDDDAPLLPGPILLAGLRWRWRREKGLPYAEHQRTYEGMIAKALAVDGGGLTISMDGEHAYPQVVKPGLLIPVGNWT